MTEVVRQGRSCCRLSRISVEPDDPALTGSLSNPSFLSGPAETMSGKMRYGFVPAPRAEPADGTAAGTS